MSLPGVQLFTNTAAPSVVPSTSNIVEFTFPVIPLGTTATGSIFPILKVPTASNAGIGVGSLNAAGLLDQVVWTLLRNGVPEMSWNGYDTVQNVQVQAGEQITVIAACSDNAVNLLLYSLNFKGWAQNSGVASAVAPGILAATGVTNFSVDKTAQTVQGVKNTTQTVNILIPQAKTPVFVKSIQMSMCTNASINGTLTQSFVSDTAGDNGTILCSITQATDIDGSHSDTASVDCYDYELHGNLTLSYSSSDAGLSFGYVTATVYYTEQA